MVHYSSPMTILDFNRTITENYINTSTSEVIKYARLYWIWSLPTELFTILLYCVWLFYYGFVVKKKIFVVKKNKNANWMQQKLIGENSISQKSFTWNLNQAHVFFFFFKLLCIAIKDWKYTCNSDIILCILTR